MNRKPLFLVLLLALVACTDRNKERFERNLLDSYFISSQKKPVQVVEWKMKLSTSQKDSTSNYRADSLTSENYEFKFDDDELMEVIQFNNKFFSAAKTVIDYDALTAKEYTASDSFDISFEVEGNIVKKIKKNKNNIVAIDELTYDLKEDILKEVKTFDHHNKLVKQETIKHERGKRIGNFVHFEADGTTLQGTRMFDQYGNCKQLRVFKDNKPYLWIYRLNYYREIDKLRLDHDGIGAMPGLVW